MDSTPHSTATHDVPLRATVFVGHWPTIPARESAEVPPGTFSPTTATLISGPTEIVLIDALHLKAEVEELGDLIERTGKRLTSIYVTHDHADHYLGIGPLLERFPGAKAVTLPHILESMRTTWDAQAAQWKLMFGDTAVPHGPMPEALEGTTLYVDGCPVNVIPVKQADIHPTSIVHVPAIDVVVAGDSIYNEVFPMLALSTPDEWKDWLDTLQVIEDLAPRMVVAGHRRPDGDDHAVAAMISQTRSFIHDFAAASEVAKDTGELFGMVKAKYPHHANDWSLLVSAHAATRRNGSAL
ncbi:MBL fold metallo-hydrolase [Streptomyces sp. ME02-8801-2C]|uniref:MBL fold metallo-hydrolase n=1 Tax=Streptomyces sp. ME02-8801-2C TaxID=3028680 RepID=UPI0029A71330|nr:MBL fold metallo-hydrolase [Streptomyces sp. ME02-8801-2C]MDX3451159.1 MBL fold metallo-hydrolase [Streptomyces sp. ME02-8801-2C]